MRLFLAGATGVVGRRLLPRLVADGHAVTGMTRIPAKADRIRVAGAEPAVADALDADAVRDAVAAARLEAVISHLTDLPTRLSPRRLRRAFAANDRLRAVGTPNLVAAATGAGARRFVAQTIAFVYAPEGDSVKSEDDPLYLYAAPQIDWLPEYADALGAPFPRRVPAWLVSLIAGRFIACSATRQRGASNATARRELGWSPRYPSWRQGFREALG